MGKKPEEAHIQALIQRFKDGETHALFELWDIFDTYVYRLMILPVGGTAELPKYTAEAASNSVWARLYHRLKDYRPLPGVRFIRWLRAVALNVKRRETPRRPPDFSLDQPMTPQQKVWVTQASIKMSRSPLQILIEREEQAEIDRAKGRLNEMISQLDPIEQYVIFSRFYDDMPYKEISQRLYGNEEKAGYLMDDVMRETLRKMRRIYRQKYGIKDIPRIKK